MTPNEKADNTETGPWDGKAFSLLREWDPEWAEACARMSTNP